MYYCSDMASTFNPNFQTPNLDHEHEPGAQLNGGTVIGVKERWIMRTKTGAKVGFEHLVCMSRDPNNCWRCLQNRKCPIPVYSTPLKS